MARNVLKRPWFMNLQNQLSAVRTKAYSEGPGMRYSKVLKTDQSELGTRGVTDPTEEEPQDLDEKLADSDLLSS